MKIQVLVIHGGHTFDNHEEYFEFLKNYKLDFDRLTHKGWKEMLGERLGETFQVITPSMINRWNAKYAEWKIWFEKIIPFLNNNVIFVGHSLGGIFLAKYLSENKFPKEIQAVFLVAAPYDAEGTEYYLGDFVLPKSLKWLEDQANHIFLYQSEDDNVVPFANVAKYQKILPNATSRIFKNRNHFEQSEFPELVEDITLLT